MPDTNVPTPYPGAKPSAPQANTGDPRAKTDKTTKEDSALTPEERQHLETHVGVLQKLLGKPVAPGGTSSQGKQQTVDEAVDEAVAGAPGNHADY